MTPARPWLTGLAALWCGCCAGGDSHLTFGLNGSTPPWGATTSVSARTLLLTVQFPRDRALGGEPVEVYAGAERRQVPTTRVLRDNAAANGCGFSHVITYDLAALGPGAYRVVHRARSGTGDPLNCADACAWTQFEGERALVFELSVR